LPTMVLFLSPPRRACPKRLEQTKVTREKASQAGSRNRQASRGRGPGGLHATQPSARGPIGRGGTHRRRRRHP
jgi:hypothetical protein